MMIKSTAMLTMIWWLFLGKRKKDAFLWSEGDASNPAVASSGCCSLLFQSVSDTPCENTLIQASSTQVLCLVMSDSKSASQADLNESNMPLLDDDAQQKGLEDKEHIEMKEEKDDSQETEKQAEDSSSSSTTNKKGNKKNKAEKKIKEKKEKGPGCVQKMSAGLNLEDRDRHAINTEIDVSC
ncbi:hypothetical protein TCAL_13423 [Tigriopus californicus]|uniref:Uncharacterized protein n=1 Tax=Tigriopus californicus TaxID=6832 RepID=A0A553P087_TIGCA|nr:hypothetical protein TCAL_13423 [Tigriopus californicus]|eukprot:TCALIF_13423-PA protein Name:"Protein of unknown function" AED:0.39 eAED:0.39 QI:0/0.5/0/0.66/0.5/1/3/0/181